MQVLVPEAQTELQQSVPWLHEVPDVPQLFEHWNTLSSQLLPLQQSLFELQLLPSGVQVVPELVEVDELDELDVELPEPEPVGTQMPPWHEAIATHVWPLSQRPSISTSPPAGASHVPAMQLSLAQSPSALHIWPSATGE
jgi:hypothetical protein